MTPAPTKPSEALRAEELGIKLKVWWIPQVPMTAFEVPVDSVEQGQFLLTALADYDLFQLEHRVKPDFCNAGGISYQHPVMTKAEWHDWPDDDFEVEELVRELTEMREAGQ